MSDFVWQPGWTEQAKKHWAEYQRTHDVSDRIGQAVGIDPHTGQVWFGEDSVDIVEQMKKGDGYRPVYVLRVGLDYYCLKVGRRYDEDTWARIRCQVEAASAEEPRQ